jgi:hypothetical protein
MHNDFRAIDGQRAASTAGCGDGTAVLGSFMTEWLG